MRKELRVKVMTLADKLDELAALLSDMADTLRQTFDSGGDNQNHTQTT
jgi:hypothetical protein